MSRVGNLVQPVLCRTIVNGAQGPPQDPYRVGDVRTSEALTSGRDFRTMLRYCKRTTAVSQNVKSLMTDRCKSLRYELRSIFGGGLLSVKGLRFNNNENPHHMGEFPRVLRAQNLSRSRKNKDCYHGGT